MITDPNTPTPETDAMFSGWINTRGILDDVRKLAQKLERERNELSRRLHGPVRCHSGHERLPLALWDCPDCVEKIREENAALKLERNSYRDALIQITHNPGWQDPEVGFMSGHIAAGVLNQFQPKKG